MGNRGSKSDLKLKSVKEQRVDGSSVSLSLLKSMLQPRVKVKGIVRCTLVTGKPALGRKILK